MKLSRKNERQHERDKDRQYVSVQKSEFIPMWNMGKVSIKLWCTGWAEAIVTAKAGEVTLKVCLVRKRGKWVEDRKYIDRVLHRDTGRRIANPGGYNNGWRIYAPVKHARLLRHHALKRFRQLLDGLSAARWRAEGAARRVDWVRQAFSVERADQVSREAQHAARRTLEAYHAATKAKYEYERGLARRRRA